MYRPARTGQCRACGKTRKLNPRYTRSPTCFRCGRSVRGSFAPDLPKASESVLSNPIKLESAGRMRNNPTPAEAALWERLREYGLGVRFRRQFVTFGWIIDFYCPRLGLGIEADGPYHAERADYDQRRDAVLKSHGITILRFPNDAILTDWPTVEAAIRTKIRALQFRAEDYALTEARVVLPRLTHPKRRFGV
jgi:very-short-patch-repair endonuclease